MAPMKIDEWEEGFDEDIQRIKYENRRTRSLKMISSKTPDRRLVPRGLRMLPPGKVSVFEILFKISAKTADTI